MYANIQCELNNEVTLEIPNKGVYIKEYISSSIYLKEFI